MRSLEDSPPPPYTEEEKARLKFLVDNNEMLRRTFAELREIFKDEPPSEPTNLLES